MEFSSASSTRAALAPLRFGSAAGRWVLAACVLGSALAGIDATVVNVASPAIGREFPSSFAALQWVITAYTLTLASLILLGGSLGDRYGRRRIFRLGVTSFASASVLCGLAPSIGWLIAARAVQGVAGALLIPASLALIQASFHVDDRARAIGAWSAFGGVATAIGPFLGGWLVQTASWRWVFLINLPVAVIVLLICRGHVPESRDTSAVGRIDALGAVLSAAGLGGITYAIIAAPARGLGSPIVISSAGLGLAALIGYLCAEAWLPNPMLPLGIFASRQFSATNAVTFLVYAPTGGIFFLLVVTLQVSAGFSPIAAGTALLPLTVVMLLLSARFAQLSQCLGPRVPLTVGPLLCCLGVLLMRRIGTHASYSADVLPAVLILGLGLSVLVAPLTATVLAAVGNEHAGIASGVNNAVARAAALIAVAALPALSGLSGMRYHDPVAFARGFQLSCLIAAGSLLLAATLAFVTVQAKGDPTDHGEKI